MSNFVASCSLCVPPDASIDVLVIEFLATQRSFFSLSAARAKYKSGQIQVSNEAPWQQNVVQLNFSEHFPSSSLPRLQLRLRVPSPGRKDLKSSIAPVCIPGPRSGGGPHEQQLALHIKKDGRLLETKVMLTLSETKDPAPAAAPPPLGPSSSASLLMPSCPDASISDSPGATPSTLETSPETFSTAAPSDIPRSSPDRAAPAKPANKRPWWSLSQLLTSFSGRHIVSAPAAAAAAASHASETGSPRHSCAFFSLGSNMQEDPPQPSSAQLGASCGAHAAGQMGVEAHLEHVRGGSIGSLEAAQQRTTSGGGGRSLHSDSAPGPGGAASRGTSADGGGGSPLHKRARVSAGPSDLTHLWSLGRSKVSVAPLAGAAGLPPLAPRAQRPASGAATPDAPGSPISRLNPAQLAFAGLLASSQPLHILAPHPPGGQHPKPPLGPGRTLGRPVSLGSRPSPPTPGQWQEAPSSSVSAAAAGAISQQHGPLISREGPTEAQAGHRRGGSQSAPVVSREGSMKGAGHLGDRLGSLRDGSGDLGTAPDATHTTTGASQHSPPPPPPQQRDSGSCEPLGAASGGSRISDQLRREICAVIDGLLVQPCPAAAAGAGAGAGAGAIISPRRFEFKQSLEALLRCDQADESVARATLDSVVMEITPFDKGTPLGDGTYARDLVLREPSLPGQFKRVTSCPDVAAALEAAAAAPPPPPAVAAAPAAPSHRHTQSAAWTSELDAPGHVRVRVLYAPMDQVSAGGISACTCIALEVAAWLEENPPGPWGGKGGKGGQGQHLGAATLADLVMQGCSLWRAAGGQARGGGAAEPAGGRAGAEAEQLLGFHAALEVRNRQAGRRGGPRLHEVQSAYCQVGPQGLADPTTTLPAFVASAAAAAAAAAAPQSFVLVAAGHSTLACFLPDARVLLVNSLGRSLSPSCKAAHVMEFGSAADFGAAFVSGALPPGAQPAQVEAHRIALQPPPGGEPHIQLFMPQ